MSDFGDKGVDKEAKRILHIPDHINVVYGLRLGYPKSRPARSLRVRRDVEDFTLHNGYENKGLE